MSEPYRIEVRSSNGNLEMDIYGNIYKSNYGGVGTPTPTRFDIIEWLMYHRCAELPSSLDILDLGYWYGDGIQYEPPCWSWRNGHLEDELNSRKEDARYKAPGIPEGRQGPSQEVVLMANEYLRALKVSNELHEALLAANKRYDDYRTTQRVVDSGNHALTEWMERARTLERELKEMKSRYIGLTEELGRVQDQRNRFRNRLEGVKSALREE